MWITPQIVSGASAYRFVRLATLGHPAPGGGNFINDFEPGSLNNRNEAAFVADMSTGGEGVFLRTPGKILHIVRTGQPAPGGGTFAPLEQGRASINEAGDVTFAFRLEPEMLPVGVNSGLYRYRSSQKKTTAVVLSGMSAPGGGTFAGVGFDTGMNNSGNIVFAGLVTGADIDPNTPPGSNGLGVGVFRAENDGSIIRVVRPGDSAPGGHTFDWAAHASINDGGDVAFGAHVAREECLGAGDQSISIGCFENVYLKRANGVIRSIAHQGQPAPGGGIYRLAYGPKVNKRREVVFTGDLTPPPDFGITTAIFLFTGGVTRIVARPGDKMPGGGTLVTATFLNDFGINNHGDVCFVAKLNQDRDGDGSADSGLYVLIRNQAVSEAAGGPRVPGTLKLVARSGTFIPGVGTIKSLGLDTFGAGGHINDNGKILLSVTTTTGQGVLLLAHPQD